MIDLDAMEEWTKKEAFNQHEILELIAELRHMREALSHSSTMIFRKRMCEYREQYENAWHQAWQLLWAAVGFASSNENFKHCGYCREYVSKFLKIWGKIVCSPCLVSGRVTHFPWEK